MTSADRITTHRLYANGRPVNASRGDLSRLSTRTPTIPDAPNPICATFGPSIGTLRACRATELVRQPDALELPDLRARARLMASLPYR